MVSKILLRYFRAIPVLQNRGIQLTDCVATKTDVENHFNSHGTGEITEIKLMNGFGFIEYKDAMDARDVVPGEICPSNKSAYNGLSDSQPSTVPILWASV
jgi:hypothetical protein